MFDSKKYLILFVLNELTNFALEYILEKKLKEFFSKYKNFIGFPVLKQIVSREL